ncbi:hypothetical protein ABIE52_000272 [Rhodococcus sp. OAS809]|uniref:hypothetical protein n=1 Tax=Rhodococcus TaxID=1827 RepID=UPI0009BC6278|nr:MULTISPECIES: hypothetical protein [Rhodococcus]MCQ4127591.1 hypothetical protein [Rhodococcus erythropolis]OQM78796.1 hypothetical protein B0E55_05252 [Rhodococcus sp. 66b]
MDWFVSVRDEDADVLVYRGGRGFDQGSVIEQVIAAGQAIAYREDGSVVGIVGKVVIDGVSLDPIPFGDLKINAEQIRSSIATQLNSLRDSAPDADQFSVR